MDKTAIIIVIVVIIAAVGFWAWQSGVLTRPLLPQPQLPEGIVLFFGDGCPHCKNVEDFLQANRVDEKLKITRLEIPFAGKTSPELRANALLAGQLAKQCKIDVSGGLGVPFMYDGKSNCFLGDVDAINFFKNETGIK